MITMHKYYSAYDLIDKIKKVSMLKNDKNFPYSDSYITIESIDPNSLFPCQYYVLKSELEMKNYLYELFKKIRIDIFNLNGYIKFELNNECCKRTLLPPVIEESIESDGKIYPLINDGMHRIFLAILMKRKLNIIYIRGSKESYYAYPLPNRWNDVKIFNTIDKNTIKKIYRIQDNKKLYRNFDSVFQNCSKPRGIN
jgi:hypothetical protein